MTHLLKCHPLLRANFVRGELGYLFDEDGRRFADFESGSWAAILGHAHPVVNAVLKDQIDRITHLGVRTPNCLAEQAAEALLALLDFPDGRCTFLNSGSEAVEFAVQAALRISGRPLALTFANTYLSAYGTSAKKSPAEWHIADWAQADRIGLEAMMDTIPFDRIGVFVLEPGGAGGLFVRFPPAPVVEEIARRVRASGGLVVVNEVTTGMGRTGRWFGFQHYRLEPDLVALGKGLGNGYPVSAVALRAEAAAALEASGHYHAQSHQNNPLGCAVALVVMRLLGEGDWIRRSDEMGSKLLAGLGRLGRSHPGVLGVRGRGMLLGLELHPGARHSGTTLQARLWERGFIVGGYPAAHPAGTGLRLDPPLTLDASEHERLLHALDELLAG